MTDERDLGKLVRAQRIAQGLPPDPTDEQLAWAEGFLVDIHRRRQVAASTRRSPPTTDDELFDSPYYERCTDPQCPVAHAYEAEQSQPHYHFTGSPDHPAWDVS